MNQEKKVDILESKQADHVTGDEVEKKEYCVSMEADEVPDKNEESQDKGSSNASEVKAELSEKCVSDELQSDSAASSLDHGQTTEPRNETSDESQMRDNSQIINDKICGINLSAEKEDEVPTKAGVQNQPPTPPPEKHLTSSPNKLCVDSVDHKNDETKVEHKDVHSKITTGSFTDYDVISKKEVQSLSEWENIHKDCLSEIPPIDPGALQDIERRAKEVAGNLDHLLHTLNNSLKSMSVIGVQSVDTYKTSVENMEVTVDASIKSMYTLIAKCEELHSYMGPLYSMSAQIKDIKRTLDVFESVCK